MRPFWSPIQRHYVYVYAQAKNSEATQQTFLVFQDVFKTSWRRLQRNTFRLPRRLQDVFAIRLPKTSSRRLAIMSSRRLRDIFKTSWKTKKCYTEDVFSTSWPRRMFVGLAAADTCIIASRKTVDILPLKFSLKILKKHLFKAWFTSLV